jgi:tetratricopeptide (TPR) repeat protein
MYVPLMAIAVLAVLAVDALARAAARAGGARAVRAVAALLVVAMVVGLGVLTLRRTAEYASTVTLARTVVERRPTAIAYHLLGEQLAIAGQMAQAETALREAIARGDSRARYQLGALMIEAGRLPEAASHFEGFVATAGVPQRLRWLQPPLLEVLTARLRLAQIYGVERRWSDSAAQARLVLDAAPRHPEATRLLALALFGAQVWPEAITVLQDYLAVRPDDATARANLGVALIAAGRLDAAVGELQRAAANAPADANIRHLLDMALADQRARAR